MKKLQCELCNSIDIVKIENDMFQCQSCGCKYTTEQAKALVAGAVETTIGSAELNRLIENAETQIELGQEGVFSTIDTIIHEYPNNYNGYWLYIKATFKIIEKNRNIDLGYRPYKSRHGSGSISLTKCKEMYLILLNLTDNNTELTKQQVIDYWESSFEKIYKGLICGEITGLWQIKTVSDIEAHSLLTNVK